MTAPWWGDAPNPGSRAALAQGCTCAVWDNCCGRGRPCKNGDRRFIVDLACPLHKEPKHPHLRLIKGGKA